MDKRLIEREILKKAAMSEKHLQHQKTLKDQKDHFEFIEIQFQKQGELQESTGLDDSKSDQTDEH